jgi:hypothetical protein
MAEGYNRRKEEFTRHPFTNDAALFQINFPLKQPILLKCNLKKVAKLLFMLVF